MSKRPIPMTVFALYLLIVFGISIVGSLFGAIKALAPYSSSDWLVLALPKVFALCAGLAFWKMLRAGVWFWAASVILGWVLAYGMGTGFFPSFNFALAVTSSILVGSIWVIYSSWDKLLPIKATQSNEGSPNA